MVDSAGRTRLIGLYQNCRAYHGELHEHAQTGGTSDGMCPLSEWHSLLSEFHMDFAAILDHRQIRHMYLPEWEDGLFIPGTEPGTRIINGSTVSNEMHYNILLPHRDLLADLLNDFPEFEFTGGLEGHFVYPYFTRERFGQLIDAIKARGGFFVHPHPKQYLKADDPLDYWFRDETGIEAVYVSMDSVQTRDNFQLWLDLLSAGKRVWACAGGDTHYRTEAAALTTIYAEEHTSASFLSHLRTGDFTCGAVGIRMCIGDTRTGGQCPFDGQKLTVCVSDFHESVKDPDHQYRLDVISDQGVVYSAPVSCMEETFVTIDTENCAFYRAEVIDETKNLRIAIGNPIWNR